MTQNMLVSLSLIFYALIGLGFLITGFVTSKQGAQYKRTLWLLLGIVMFITIVINWSYIHGLEMRFR
jgi:hypothetical protein